jgi:hypothetical protein
VSAGMASAISAWVASAISAGMASSPDPRRVANVNAVVGTGNVM